MSFVKSLVPRSPSGINILGECDIFYPLQTKIADWYPKPKTTPGPTEEEEEEELEELLQGGQGQLPGQSQGPEQGQQPGQPQLQGQSQGADGANGAGAEGDAVKGANTPTPIKAPPGPLIDDGGDNYDAQKHPGEIYVTGPPRRITAPPRRTDEFFNRFVYKNAPLREYFNQPVDYWGGRKPIYKGPPLRYVDSFPRKPIYNPNYQSAYVNEMDLLSGATMNEKMLRPPESILYSRLQSRRKNWYELGDRPMSSGRDYYIPRGRSGRSLGHSPADRKRVDTPKKIGRKPQKKVSSNDIEDHREWHHYRRHKERRDLYEQLQAITSFDGFEMKTCILRMICEANHYLLPPGKSLFQDVFRTLFTLPLKHDLNDEFSEAMRRNSTECQTSFGSKCRYSILGFLLSNQLGMMK